VDSCGPCRATYRRRRRRERKPWERRRADRVGWSGSKARRARAGSGSAQPPQPRPLATDGDDHRVLARARVLVRRAARIRAGPLGSAPDRLVVLSRRTLNAGLGHRARWAALPHRGAWIGWLGHRGRPEHLADRRVVERLTLLARGCVLAQPRWRRHLSVGHRRLVLGHRPALCPLAGGHLRPRSRSAAPLLPVTRRRPHGDPAGKPDLGPRLPPGRTRRLVHRAGHRWGHQRPAHRCLPRPAGLSLGFEPPPHGAACLRHPTALMSCSATAIRSTAAH
jgi:hypothetical protein